MKTPIVLLLLVLCACSQTTKKQLRIPYPLPEKKEVAAAAMPAKDTLPAEKPPVLTDFYQSECLENCGRSSEVHHKSLKNGKLKVRVSKLLNCSTTYDCTFTVTDNAIDFRVKIRPDLVKRRDGSVDTVVMHIECDCLYFLDFTVTGIEKMPDKVFVNGERLKNAPIHADVLLR